MAASSFKKNNTGAIRAVATLVVLFCHLNNTMSPRVENPLLVLSFYGSAAVGLFFFHTGYNLMYNYMERDDWAKDFWLKKLSRIYLPFVVVNIFGRIGWLAHGSRTSLSAIVRCALGFGILNTELWYIQCCMLMYTLFFLVFALLYRYGGKLRDKRLVVTVLCIAIWVIYGEIYRRWGAYGEKSSYRSWTLLFGMLTGIYADSVISFWTKRKWEIFFAAAFVAVVIPQYERYGLEIALPLVGKLDYAQLRIFTVTVLANSLIMGEDIKSRFLAVIDKYSLYIYLAHAPLYVLYRSAIVYIESDLLYLLVYLSSVAVSAFALYHLAKLFEKALRGLKKKIIKV